MSRDWKTVALACGVLCAAMGLVMALNGIGWLILLIENLRYGSSGALHFGMAWLALTALFLGGGATLTYHASHSLDGKPSRVLRLPPLWAWGWGLLIGLALGEALRRAPIGSLFFPPLFVVAAALPPLAALAWVTQAHPGELSWRQFASAFVVGATLAVGLALALEILLPLIFFGLVDGLYELARQAWRPLVDGLAGDQVGEALSSYSFVFAMIELALVAPLAEEFAKPLFTLPLLKRIGSPRRAFLVGAAAGAGFAALENLLYTGFGVSYWGGVLAVRALGAAIHPLASGLVALAWYRLLGGAGAPRRAGMPGEAGMAGGAGMTGKAGMAGGAGTTARPYGWAALFAVAVGVHALWNGGIMVLLALAGADFFGKAPPEVDVLGATLAGVLLALLAVLGAAAWMGLRAAASALFSAEGEVSPVAPFSLAPDSPPTDRALALWALICLIFILPLGLAALRLLRGGP